MSIIKYFFGLNLNHFNVHPCQLLPPFNLIVVLTDGSNYYYFTRTRQ